VLPIAVDGMGGDHAPHSAVAGAVLAAEAGLPIVLVGDPDALSRAASDAGQTLEGIDVVAASEVIAMDEDPGFGVRRKKDASMVRAAELVRDGHASAMVGAGNTGATMASALLRMGRLRGIKRPAIAALIPEASGARHSVLLDAGANADCTPQLLAQFARMGAVYARVRLGIAEPTVGVLNIGEEAGKGNSLVRETVELLSDTRWQSEVWAIFAGNAEGGDIMTTQVDVIVTDGFTGNVALKSMEGACASISTAAKALLEAAGVDWSADAGLSALWRRLDPDENGGAVLLGVDGVCVICHGASEPRGILGAIQVASELVELGIVGAISAAMAPEDV
jgi:glycerol-3-phosphate acyltransferase PlsX